VLGAVCEVHAVKIENIKKVKARFNRIVSELPASGSVIITKNGRPCAALMPITKDTDLEIVALSQNKRFWNLYDSAAEKANKEGWTPLDDA
jgi:prevent-host-death family protein